MVMGWVRTFRNNQFIALNDGSTNQNLQVVVDFANADEALLRRITTGAAVKVTGEIVESLGKGQSIELKANDVEILGDSDPEKYPLQPKKHSLEFLREKAHLRMRTATFGAIFRVRNTLAYAVHRFFQEKGFLLLHTPVITASDAEGAGETFRVTTFDLSNIPFSSEAIDKVRKLYTTELIDFFKRKNSGSKISEVDTLLKSYNKESRATDPNATPLSFERLITSDLEILKKVPSSNSLKILSECGIIMRAMEFQAFNDGFFEKKINDGKELIRLPKWFIKGINKSRNGISAKPKELSDDIFCLSFYNYKYVHRELRNASDRRVIVEEDFFGKSTNLTVSGQLEGELGAMAFSDIYTFGPTFRAENSNTTRHLAEFWMIEPEMAFYDLDDNADLAEELLKYVIADALEKHSDDLEFLGARLAEEEKQKPQNERSELSLVEKLRFVIDNDFERLTYTEAIEILKNSTPNKKKKFVYPIEAWGADLQSEHERYLVEKHFKKPVILTDYPAEIKAFYMRRSDDGKTVRAMDILFPGIGEIVGGSQREERLDKLTERMEEMHIPVEEMSWYLDTRRFGTCPHSGFGLGFERLVLFVTGMGNIRDVIPFPRFPKSAEF